MKLNFGQWQYWSVTQLLTMHGIYLQGSLACVLLFVKVGDKDFIMAKELIRQDGSVFEIIEVRSVVDEDWPRGRMCLVLDSCNRLCVAVLTIRGIKGNETWVEFDPEEHRWWEELE